MSVAVAGGAIGISGSGNSPNVLNGLFFARQMGATTIGMTGFDGGQLKDLVDVCIHVLNHCMEQVEDLHLMLEPMLSVFWSVCQVGEPIAHGA